MAIILKIYVRFTLKELRCKLSSSFYIISDSGDGDILFLQATVMFEMKKKNESKKTSGIRIFSQTRRKKIIQQFNKK